LRIRRVGRTYSCYTDNVNADDYAMFLCPENNAEMNKSENDE